MALNRTVYTGGNYIPNQNFECVYYAPKSKEEIENLIIDRSSLSYQQIENIYAEKIQNPDGAGWVTKAGISFTCAEGTEDVYKKMGLESSLDELLPREQIEEIKWRIITNCNHIDFQPSGLIEFGQHKFRIVNIVYAFSTGTTPNRLKFYKKGNMNLDDIRKMSPKLIILK